MQSCRFSESSKHIDLHQLISRSVLCISDIYELGLYVEMAQAKSDREYDIVVVGATGYTGKLTAHHIARSLPTNLKWIIAGRSNTKLDALAAELKDVSQDRLQPSKIESDSSQIAHLHYAQ